MTKPEQQATYLFNEIEVNETVAKVRTNNQNENDENLEVDLVWIYKNPTIIIIVTTFIVLNLRP